MSIQVISVGGSRTETDEERFIKKTLILLDMCDSDAVEDGKRIVSEIDRSLKRKNLGKTKRVALEAIRDEFEQRIRRIEK